jgi:hypothetical protein
MTTRIELPGPERATDGPGANCRRLKRARAGRYRPAVLFFSIALAVSGMAAAAETGADSKADESPAQKNAADQNPVLDKGMSASDVIKLIGKPAAVENLKTDELKAEKWTYRQLVGHRVVQEATNVINESAFIGTGGQGANTQGTRATLQYTLKHIKSYRMTALLMVNDKLVVARQWNEQQVTYDD